MEKRITALKAVIRSRPQTFPGDLRLNSRTLQAGESPTHLCGLLKRPQAPGADFYLVFFPVLKQRLLVDVGLKPGFGVAVGVADVVAAHAGFKTKLASHRVFRTSFAPVPGKRKRDTEFLISTTI